MPMKQLEVLQRAPNAVGPAVAPDIFCFLEDVWRKTIRLVECISCSRERKFT